MALQPWSRALLTHFGKTEAGSRLHRVFLLLAQSGPTGKIAPPKAALLKRRRVTTATHATPLVLRTRVIRHIQITRGRRIPRSSQDRSPRRLPPPSTASRKSLDWSCSWIPSSVFHCPLML